jgi:serine/threonine-protein kinase
MARSCQYLGGFVGLLFFLAAVPAAAQATANDKASAEALFDAALELMKKGNYAEACPKLENSQRIDPGVGTLLYLGECYERIGRTASAWATFREAASQAEAAGEARRGKAARDRIAKLEPELAYLTIEIAEGTRALPGLRIRRDGADAGSGIAGAAVPVDPGTVKVEVTAPDHESFTVSVRIQPRAHQTVLIPTLAAVEPSHGADVAAVAAVPPAEQQQPQPAAAPPPSEPKPPAEAKSDGSTQRIIGLSVAGLGLVGIGVGSYFGAVAMSDEKKADHECSPTQCDTQTELNHSTDAHHHATISNIAFATGGGLLAVGAVVFFTAPKKSSSVGVTPIFAPGFAGVSIGGRL